MSCELYQEMISANIDGELTAREIEQLQAHLDQCPVCRDVHDLMIDQNVALGCEDIPGQSEALRDRITSRLGMKKKESLVSIPTWVLAVDMGYPIIPTPAKKKESTLPMSFIETWGIA